MKAKMPKTNKKPTPAPKKEHTNGVRKGGRKRTYERTTPVGRVQKHLVKAFKIGEFAVARMQAWEHSVDEDLIAALAHARNGVAGLGKALGYVGNLYGKNWTPPKKSTTVTFGEGEEVRINEKYREKYLQIYPAAVIDALIVAKCLESGEIAVRHGSQSPFIVAKSHIEKKRAKNSAPSESVPAQK